MKFGFQFVIGFLATNPWTVSAINPGFLDFLKPIASGLVIPPDLFSNFLIRPILNNLGLIPKNYSGPAGRDRFAEDFLFGLHVLGVNETLSPLCHNDTKEWIKDLLQPLQNPYALKMLDSFGKIPSGISRGNILWFGAYDLCLAAEKNKTICDSGECSSEMVQAANYCVVRLKIGEIELPSYPGYGACLPYSCTPSDVDKFVVGLLHIIEPLEIVTAVEGTLCQEPIPEQEGTTAIIVIVSIIAALVLGSTLAHLVLRQFDDRWNRESRRSQNQSHDSVKRSERWKEVAHREEPNLAAIELSEVNRMQDTGAKVLKPHTNLEHELRTRTPLWMRAALCFSLVESTKSIFAPASSGQLNYLHGIRFLSMCWIILGHVFHLGQNFFDNQLDVIESLKQYGQQIVVSAYYAVDTFFLLSGLCVTLSLLQAAAKYRNIVAPFAFSYLRRIWRLTPLYIIVLMVYMFVVPYVVNGPYPIYIRAMGAPTEYCKESWWANVLYVNNFFPANKKHMCMEWTWFMSADMQLFLITPPLIWLVIKYPKVGITTLCLLVVGGISTVTALVTLYGIPLTAPQLQLPLVAGKEYDPSYEYIYDKPWTAAIPYFAGCLLAVLIHKMKNRPKFKLNIYLLGWSAAFLAAYGAIYGIYHSGLETRKDMDITERSVFAALSRPAWVLVVSWVIFACQYGYSFAVKGFLSWSAWIPLSRLTFAAYLIHFLVLQLYFTSLRAMIGYSVYQVITIFFSQVVATYLVSYVASVFVEVPLRKLERFLMQS